MVLQRVALRLLTCLAIHGLHMRTSALPTSSNTAQTLLAQAALTEILSRGAPILGYDDGCSPSANTCDWMAKVADDTKLVHMNLPGTHDSATWNYTQATQDSLLHYTGPIPPASAFQCQEHSLFQSLNAGIRVFDLRFAYNPGNDTIGFHHSQALLAPDTRIEDVLFGLYSWLDKHPTEAVLVSLNYEGGTGTPNDEAIQVHMYEIFQSNLAKKYWVQTNGTLGTLGEARGKLTLLQRWEYTLLPSTDANRLGIYLYPEGWTDNAKIIDLVYNTGKTAYIEDYYYQGADLSADAGTETNVQSKFNATIAHIQNATMFNQGQLYISFASAGHLDAVPAVTPKVMALGNGTDVPGVNQLLLPWLQERKGKRFGIIMLDFFDAVPGLVEAVIGL